MLGWRDEDAMAKQKSREGPAEIERRLRDPRLRQAAKLLGELADERCDASASFAERSREARRIAQAAMSRLVVEKDDDDEREDSQS
jgi:hypothetical protein